MPEQVLGGVKYGEFIKELLEEEDARKVSFEQRGAAIITASGTLVSLLFALAALVTKVEDYVLPGQARQRLWWAALLFVVAAVLGILTNFPLLYTAPNLDEVRAALRDKFEDSVQVAEQRVGGTRLKLIMESEHLNKVKGWLLSAALLSQIGGIVCVAWAVSRVLES
jgi:membrane protein YqaA with SNARE-associated domain